MEIDGVVVSAGKREAAASTAMGTVRVRGVVPGDRIRIRISHAGVNETWGKAVAIIEPSPERVVERCSAAGACGGCPWQAWELAAQRREKARRLMEALSQAGTVHGTVEEIRGAGDGFGCRNKILLAAGGSAGSLKLGLYVPRTHKLIPAEACPVHAPAGAEAVRGIERVLDGFRIAPWDERRRTGTLRSALVRVAPETGRIGVVLMIREWPLKAGPVIGRRMLGIPGVVSVHASHNPDPGAAFPGTPPRLIAGTRRIEVRVRGTAWLLSPSTFFQTNGAALPLLVDAVGMALPERVGVLADLYAGAGLFALSFARRAEQVVAVEADREAVSDLRASADLNGLRNVRTIEGDAAASLSGLHAPDAVVLDPPRAGIPAPLVKRIAEWRPSRIVYVSCSLDALARDLIRFRNAGFSVLRAMPVDMFPHTPHLETVVSLVPG